MDVILCHTTADFDALGASVGLTRLLSGARIVLSGGAHPGVRDFLALHRDEYALIERRSVNPNSIRSLTVVDTQKRDRLGKAAEWLDLPHLSEVVVYDHHPEAQMDIPATRTQIELVGATTTLIVEHLKAAQINLTPPEATVMALGIHVDTGSLTFDASTARDAIALAWLIEQGAISKVVTDYIDSGLSPKLQELLTEALDKQQIHPHVGYRISSVLLKTSGYVPGLSSLASQLMEITETDALLLGASYTVRDEGKTSKPESDASISSDRLQVNESKDERLTVIGRSRILGTNLNQLFQPLGGGGHSQAASLTLRGVDSQALNDLVNKFLEQIPAPPTARELMSSPVRTIPPDTTIEQAQRILLRYGHSGLCVVKNQADEANNQPENPLVGIISRRDIDLALHHGFSHAPVKGYMTPNLKTIAPDTSLPEIESLMVTYDIGRLPVIDNGQLVGIVTRTDVLRQLHQDKLKSKQTTATENDVTNNFCLLTSLRDRLSLPMWELLTTASQLAEARGWHLYLVGGAVRDLILSNSEQVLMLSDIDLVVDGFHQAADVGAGVEMARSLQAIYSNARLDIHGAFQTAALLWHKDPVLDSLWVDIATARTEFYPYPAANPEVEASSIRQDLYRRDFTINALAVRLTNFNPGLETNNQLPILDFFGGLFDLQAKQIRVLHANSFIEDPTRIYRAVRFAVRLGFQIEAQTEGYIRYAIASGVYDRSLNENNKAPALQTRLKTELKYILQSPYWKSALQLLGNLGALRCLHPTLELDRHLWRQIRLVDRCINKLIAKSQLDKIDSYNIQLESLQQDWQMRLEVLIAYLQPEYRAKVANQLQLTADTIERLESLEQARVEVTESLPRCQRPSEVVKLLKKYELPKLILIAVKGDRPLRRIIWQYLTKWANIQPVLNGNDLKSLGYKPGKQFKQILDELLAARLDGAISDRASAEAFISKHFPWR